MSNQIIKIGKRASDKVVCWRVKADELTPNTLLVVDPGVTVVVKADGESGVLMSGKSTVFALFNAGKNRKLIGGNKPYGDFGIYAIDQRSEFTACWSLANNPLVCVDKEVGARYEIKVNGEIGFVVNNFIVFTNKVIEDENSEVTEEDFNNMIRNNIINTIVGRLSKELENKSIENCKAVISNSNEKLVDELNETLRDRGIEVRNITFGPIETPQFDMDQAKIGDAKLDTYITFIKNKGKQSDIETEGQKVSKVDVPLMNAQANLERARGSEKSEQAFMYCPSCKTKNDLSATSCKNCGMSFKK